MSDDSLLEQISRDQEAENARMRQGQDMSRSERELKAEAVRNEAIRHSGDEWQEASIGHDPRVCVKSRVRVEYCIPGAGADAPMEVTAKGGKQSAIPWRFDLIKPEALFVLARVMDYGARRYGADNFYQIDVHDHLNHVLQHVYAYLAGDRQDDHLGHALARAMGALAVALGEGYDARQADEKCKPDPPAWEHKGGQVSAQTLPTSGEGYFPK